MGADWKIPEKDGYTPMHGAGFQGRAEIAKLLIEHGLDKSDRHQDGYTPMLRACWGNEARHAETGTSYTLDERLGEKMGIRDSRLARTGFGCRVNGYVTVLS